MVDAFDKAVPDPQKDNAEVPFAQQVPPTDAVVPAVPESPVPALPEPEPEEKKRAVRANLIDKLPNEIKIELDILCTTKNWGEKSIKEALEAKFPDNETLKNVSLWMYRNYRSVNTERFAKQREAEEKLVEAQKASLTDIKTILDTAVGETSIENKKQALIALYNRCELRMSAIESIMSSGYISPQWESVYGSYVREQRYILEKAITFQEELKYDMKANFAKDLEEFSRVILTAVFSTFSQVAPDKDAALFKDKLVASLDSVLKNYKETRKQKA